MSTTPDARRPWTPQYKYTYGLYTISYNKGGFRQKEGWDEKDFDVISEMGGYGWEAFSVTKLNDTQFLVFFRFAMPWDVTEEDVDPNFMAGMTAAAEKAFSS